MAGLVSLGQIIYLKRPIMSSEYLSRDAAAPTYMNILLKG